jgi:hypothetical protein
MTSKFGERNKMESQFSPEALKSLDGKKLPVTIEVNGEKQVIGEATLAVVEGGVQVAASIEKGFEGLVKPDLRHFSLVNTDYRDDI